MNSSYFSLSIDLSAVFDDNLFGGSTTSRTKRFDFPDDLHALHDGAEDDVLAVQPLRLDGADEELGTIGVRPGIGHAQNAFEKKLFYVRI